MEVDEETPSTSAAQPKAGEAGEEKAGGKLHVLGIGGRRAKRGGSKATGTKKTPGEIRIQKGEGAAAVGVTVLLAYLSGHTSAAVVFPAKGSYAAGYMLFGCFPTSVKKEMLVSSMPVSGRLAPPVSWHERTRLHVFKGVKPPRSFNLAYPWNVLRTITSLIHAVLTPQLAVQFVSCCLSSFACQR